MHEPICPVCHFKTPKKIGIRIGQFRSGFIFEYFQCERCWFGFVANPWTEYEKIYSKAYYEGKGADPLVDYWFELNHPDKTIRFYEYFGIAKIAIELLKNSESKNWLDYGCGHGGLVRYINSNKLANCIGFEEGYIVKEARSKGIYIASKIELNEMEGKFDLVTAIEVIEHVSDPISFLKAIRKMLRKGGILF